MKFTLVIYLFLILTCISSFAQNDITLTGKIFSDKEPQEACNAVLTVDGVVKDSVLSNKTGRYEFKVARGHEYYLTIKKSGFVSKKLGPIPIFDDQKLDYLAFNFELERKNQIYFAVQLFSGINKVKVDVFKFNDITERKDDGFYRYTSGVFLTEKEAEEYRDKLIVEGQSQAFVVAYKDNLRITLSEARYQIEFYKK